MKQFFIDLVMTPKYLYNLFSSKEVLADLRKVYLTKGFLKSFFISSLIGTISIFFTAWYSIVLKDVFANDILFVIVATFTSFFPALLYIKIKDF